MKYAARPVDWTTHANGVAVRTLRTPAGETVPGLLDLTAVTDRIVRVRYTERDRFCERPSLMTLPRNATGSMAVEDGPSGLVLHTGVLRIGMDGRTGALNWSDASGRRLAREPAGGRELEEMPIVITRWNGQHDRVAEETADGVRVRARGGQPVVDRMGYRVRMRFDFADGEAIYGLGQHEEGILNYRGHVQYLYQQNMKVAMPVLVSSLGYALFFDTAASCTFRDDARGSCFTLDAADELDFYFLYGPSFDRLVAGMRILTGRPAPFPRWAFGYIQSKERYKSQAELLAVAREYRRRGLPLDGLVQDWHAWPEGQWGYKIFDPARYPDPKGLCDALHAEHVRLMVSVWPCLRGEQNADLEEMRNGGHLLGDGATVDAFSPAARALYWEQARRGYFDHGVDAWWCDCTEPFEAGWKGEFRPEPEQQRHEIPEVARSFLDPTRINAYTMPHAQGIYEGQRAVTDARRVVNLTRSACPGQQRYGAITWSGDVEATWERLRRQIADGLNFCVTGNPRWTLDIGAFFVKPGREWFRAGEYPGGVEDLGYRELYTRWFQLGAFLPMFRSHGTDTPREIWRFGEPGTPFYDTLRSFAELRYRLMPYLYSAAAMEWLDDYTLFRMLAFDFPGDPRALSVSDQFMFGPALLVCPVTRPMYYGPDSTPLDGADRTRRVYLPAGCSWIDVWTGERFAGGQDLRADAPLEKMPIYARAGSVVPMGPPIPFADAEPDAPWDIHLFTGADGRFTLYEDEGDGYACERGIHALTPMAWSESDGALHVGARRGEYPGMPRQRLARLWRDTPFAPARPAGRPDAEAMFRGEDIRLAPGRTGT